MHLTQFRKIVIDKNKIENLLLIIKILSGNGLQPRNLLGTLPSKISDLNMAYKHDLVPSHMLIRKKNVLCDFL